MHRSVRFEDSQAPPCLGSAGVTTFESADVAPRQCSESRDFDCSILCYQHKLVRGLGVPGGESVLVPERISKSDFASDFCALPRMSRCTLRGEYMF